VMSDPSADRRLDLAIGRLLRIGVSTAALVTLAGGIIYLMRHGGSRVEYDVFRLEPAGMREVTGIWRSASAGRGRGIIEFGLLLLTATPVFRVAFAAFGFARERDWLYVVVSSIVLAVLLYSLFGSS
jgi:uncharacterized membrane protein